VREIDQARFLYGAQKLASVPRVIVVGKRGCGRSEEERGKGARHYCAGGTAVRHSTRVNRWFGHGFSLL
jgi:hypothetical protein